MIIKKESIETVTQKTNKQLEKEKVLYKISSGDFALDFNKKPCPSLKDNKCTIYKDPLRPSLCHEFPIFIKGNSVWFSSFCTAVQEKKFEDVKKKLESMDVKVLEI